MRNCRLGEGGDTAGWPCRKQPPAVRAADQAGTRTQGRVQHRSAMIARQGNHARSLFGGAALCSLGINGILEAGAGNELRHFASRDLDLRAGARIETVACCASDLLEGAKADDGNRVAFLDRLDDRFGDGCKNTCRFSFRDVVFGCDFFSEF